MAVQTTSEKVILNLLWRLAERWGAQLVTFFVSIVLARLLDPSVYGTISLVTVFISIMQVFVDSGLGNSLIQKKDADDLDFSTVFYTNIIFCVLLYFVLFFCAPYIAAFYEIPQLNKVIRVLGLTIIIAGVKNVQQAYISKHLLFKKFFYATLGGTIGSAVVGIGLAYYGFGVWALVFQSLFNTFVDTIILWFTVKWRPKRMFSYERLKSLYSFGWKILVSKLIDTIYNDIRQLVIGKLYTAESLAFYNRGKHLPNLLVTNINSSIDSVLFPVMSKSQNDKASVKSMVRTSIRASSYLLWPMMIGLCIISEPVIRILLTEKWLDCTPFMRIFCVALAFQPIHSANLNAIKAMGRSDLYLKMNIVKKIGGLIILLIAIPFGVLSICYSVLIYNVFAQIINSMPNKRLLQYSYSDQLKDIVPYIFMALLMGGLIYPLSFLHCSDVVKILLQIFIGIFVYIGESMVFNIDIFNLLYTLFKRLTIKSQAPK